MCKALRSAVRWAVVLLSRQSVDDQGAEAQGPLQIAPAMVSQCHRSGSGLRGERESATGVSSYMAEGLDGTGFSSSPCQTVPHGGWGVGGWVERVLFSQRQHHGISLRLGFPKEWLFD